ncbi:MAG: hypothetical protein ACFE9T_07775 [Promethearchaeota archaeon]
MTYGIVLNVKTKILFGILHMEVKNRYQHDYINWYIEQKEKFIKKFLNKERGE